MDEESRTDEQVRQIKLEEKFTKLDEAFRIKEFASAPHPISMVISIVGTLGTVLALLLTVQSLGISRKAVQVSEQNMKVGQRAYLVIRNSKTSVDKFAADPCLRKLWSTFEILNLGNTPASDISVIMTIASSDGIAPIGWDFRLHGIERINLHGPQPIPERDKKQGVIIEHFSDIAQKDRSNESVRRYIKYTRDALMRWLTYTPPSPLANALIRYRDVFGDYHEEKWASEIYMNYPLLHVLDDPEVDLALSGKLKCDPDNF